MRAISERVFAALAGCAAVAAFVPIASTLTSACGTDETADRGTVDASGTCNAASAPANAYGLSYFPKSALPSGACRPEAATCTLATQDPCADPQSMAPVIDWRCVCTIGTWTCTEVYAGGALCVEPPDAAIDAIDAGDAATR